MRALLCFALLLAAARGVAADARLREGEGMRYEVHRSPLSDAALPECDLAVLFAYRERVEDAQTLIDSAVVHQQGVCHMHVVFVAWDAPHLKNQVRGEREREREEERKKRKVVLVEPSRHTHTHTHTLIALKRHRRVEPYTPHRERECVCVCVCERVQSSFAQVLRSKPHR